jgi:transcriptional regulator with XRE-family HTH domain
MISSSTPTSTNSFHRLWNRFSKSKTFREQYVAGYVKRSIPAQIRALMKRNGLTQQKLAQQSGLTQGVISRAADLNYGDLTLNTIIRIAAGFDCAFVGKYVPFTEFVRHTDKDIDVDIPTFEEQSREMEKQNQATQPQESAPIDYWKATIESLMETIRSGREQEQTKNKKGQQESQSQKNKAEKKKSPQSATGNSDETFEGLQRRAS